MFDFLEPLQTNLVNSQSSFPGCCDGRPMGALVSFLVSSSRGVRAPLWAAVHRSSTRCISSAPAKGYSGAVEILAKKPRRFVRALALPGSKNCTARRGRQNNPTHFWLNGSRETHFFLRSVAGPDTGIWLVPVRIAENTCVQIGTWTLPGALYWFVFQPISWLVFQPISKM